MNLHEWISGRVEAVEKTARKAVKCTSAEWVALGSLVLTVAREDGEQVAGVDVIEAVNYRYDDALVHAAAHDPAAVLRRCEADRRVLARHKLNPEASWLDAAACHGCGVMGDCDDSVTDNLNDCPELLDLAHAHGITETELAALGRPTARSRPPETPGQARARQELAELLFPGESVEGAS